MRKYIIALVSVVALLSTASAQNSLIVPSGWVIEGDELTYSLPTTQLTATILVEKSEFKAGAFARYGSKYLGVSCELADKSEHRIIDGSISLVCPNSLYSNSLSEKSSAPEALASYTQLIGYGVTMSEEDRAREAALRIFAIRRQREELVTGDVGEGVFGAGLDAALASMQREEVQLLELFIGRTLVSRYSRSFYIQPDAELKSYVLCRFSASEGVVSSLSASPIYLQITPNKMPVAAEAKANDKGVYTASVMDYWVAAQCQCTLFNDTKSVAEAMLPIFEFGRIYKLDLPKQYQTKYFGE